MNAFAYQFFHLLSESVPLFLAGLAVGSALETWLPTRWIERWLNAGSGSVAVACLAGALLPGCAMSTVPVATSLRARGTRVGTVAAFLMIAPLLSPHTVVLTAALVSWPMAALRVALSFAVALGLGVLLNRLPAPAFNPVSTPAALPEEGSNCCGNETSSCGCSAGKPPASGLRRWFSALGKNLRLLGPLLLLGLAVASLLTVLIPLQDHAALLRSGWQAYLGALVVGIPAYVCDGGEIPLTRSLLALGIGPGPAFTFMMASVGTCFGTIAMSGRIIGWRNTALSVLATLVAALGGGLILEQLPF